MPVVSSTFIALPARNLAQAKPFYTEVFAMYLTDTGSGYAMPTTGATDLRRQGDPLEMPATPMVVIKAPDLEVTQ